MHKNTQVVFMGYNYFLLEWRLVISRLPQFDVLYKSWILQAAITHQSWTSQGFLETSNAKRLSYLDFIMYYSKTESRISGEDQKGARTRSGYEAGGTKKYLHI